MSWRSSLIGAEKPRLSDSTGGSRDVLEHEGLGALASASSTPRSTVPPADELSGRSRPSRPTRPIASGITIGSLLGWPGVGGTVCATSSR